MNSVHPRPTPKPYGARHDAAAVAALADDLRVLGDAGRLAVLLSLARPAGAEEVARAAGCSEAEARAQLEALAERGLIRPAGAEGEPRWLAVPARLAALGHSVTELVQAEGSEPDDTVMVTRGSPSAAPLPPVATASYLLVASGPDAGTRFALTADRTRWTVGREEDRDFQLPNDPFASGRHAEIQADRLGFLLVDVFSANGTYLNFVRVPRGSRVPLKPGDVVGVGRTVLVFQRE